MIALALKDLRHEWRMSLCVMLAVAAIATPLLLFFGLKSGVVTTLRTRLLNNPATLEILSIAERRLDDDWFSAVRQDPDVAFVIPRTRRLAAQAEFRAPSGKKKSLDLHPTAPGDTLLTHFETPIPGEGECVLSAEAGRALEARAGDRVQSVITRDRGTVRVTRELLVRAVLPDGAGVTAAAYIPLKSLEQIETFKDGQAVPELNWPGADPVAFAVTPEVALVLEKPLDAIRRAMLTQNTGFAALKEPDDSETAALLPGLPAGRTVYLLSTVGGPATHQDLRALADRVRGRRDACLIPVNRTLTLKIGGTDYAVHAGAALSRELPGTFSTAAKALPHAAEFALAAAPRTVLLPAAEAAPGRQTVTAVFDHTDSDGQHTTRTVSFDAEVLTQDGLPAHTAFVPLSLFGQLSLLQTRQISFGQLSGNARGFLLMRQGYTGFRMYAAGLEQVRPLIDRLTAMGIKTSGRADRIEEILSLDKYLNLLFWLIAAASLVGGCGCLAANVYANVERKRKELAVLRLLGVHGGRLCLFPLTGVWFLVSGGMLVSFGAYKILSYSVNSVFADHLTKGESFCAISLSHALCALGIAWALALTAGLAASRPVLKIDPAESLRDE